MTGSLRDVSHKLLERDTSGQSRAHGLPILGHRVTCVDTGHLQSGAAPLYEPGVDEMLRLGRGGSRRHQLHHGPDGTRATAADVS
jgi:hypothetical protein